eukprot:TRINITY_DN112_c0_g1_i1.p1 TRINITY_DN112_c0_g1~~TRINITY_DN112_c0_g1_i1.p1  ORF type:complete len:666 (+),score=192.00 TRINITY_DN112_c0_g1_i1:35-2032(+)
MLEALYLDAERRQGEAMPAMLSRHLPRAAARLAVRRQQAVTAVATRAFASSQGAEPVVYAYNTPAFYKTTPEDLTDKWDNLGFAIRTMNGHVRYTWKNGEWDKGLFVPAPYQLMHINSGALHYGVSCFEGLKAFNCKDGKIRVMNPKLNAARMQRGSKALLMPEVPEDMFVNAVREAVRRNKEFVPPHGHNASMYIRPLLFASGQMLGLAPLAEEYTFFVTVMPAGGYFGKGAEVGVKAFVTETQDRAAPMGLGNVKAAGNYAADLRPVHGAQKEGFNTTLYLDAKERKYVEEFSVCNFIGITKDNRYVTPKSDTILASTTNKMMMQLARDRGMTVEERPIDFEKEIGDFAEIGMCGTAAVVVKVQSITRGSKVWEYNNFDTISSLRAQLTGIQQGEVEDKHGWMIEVGDAVDLTDKTRDIIPPLSIESFTPGMVDAETQGSVQKVGSEALQGHERELLRYVVENAEANNPDSVLAAMDSFWNKVFQNTAQDKWDVRGKFLEEKVAQKVSEKTERFGKFGRPVRCLELGTYCGYSALRIAKNLPEGATLLSVEQDELFAAIATKIIEFAGLENKVKIWMGTVHSEITHITERLGKEPADFILCDHSKERFVPDLKLLEECGAMDASTTVLGDVEVYPGETQLPRDIVSSIQKHFIDKEFELVSMV